MAWTTKAVLLFSILFGAVIYSSFGLSYFNAERLRHGGIPLILCIPALMAIGTLWVCHRIIAKHSEPLRITPFLFCVGVFSVVPGMILASCLWGITGSFLLNQAWEKAKADGYAAEPLPHKSVDFTDDNAVVWLGRARAAIKLDSNGKEAGGLPDFLRQATSGKVDPVELLRIKRVLQDNQKALALLSRATQCSKINWEPIGYDFNNHIPSLGHYLYLARLMACRSIVAAQAGRYEQAAQAIGEDIWLAQAIFLTKTMIGDMIGVAINHMALDGVQYRFQKLPEKALDEIWTVQVKPEELTRAWKEGLSMELIFSRKVFAAEGPSMFGKNTFDAVSYFIFGPFIQFDSASGIQWGEKLRACFELSYPQIEPSYQKVDTEFHKEGWLFSQIAEPYFVKMYGKTLACATCLRLSRLGLAGRKYYEKNGRWPAVVEALGEWDAQKDDLIDSFNGKKVQLVKSGDSLLIYSVGPDLVDDKGIKIYDRNQPEKGGDLVFRLSPPSRKR